MTRRTRARRKPKGSRKRRRRGRTKRARVVRSARTRRVRGGNIEDELAAELRRIEEKLADTKRRRQKLVAEQRYLRRPPGQSRRSTLPHYCGVGELHVGDKVYSRVDDLGGWIKIDDRGTVNVAPGTVGCPAGMAGVKWETAGATYAPLKELSRTRTRRHRRRYLTAQDDINLWTV